MTLPGLSADDVFRAIEPGARARRNKRLLVYLHVPFCTSKCHFCDWVVGIETKELTTDGELRARYVAALEEQIADYGPRLAALGYEVTNIYWGGGTPTRLEAKELDRICAALARSFDLTKVREHTLECSPETVTADKLAVLRAHGLGRLSIGVQSFDGTILRRMGRAHDVAQASAAIELARAAGIDNLNIDLIAGFPDQPAESQLDSVRRAIALEVPHVSLYVFRAAASELVAVKQLQRGHRRSESEDRRLAAYRAATATLEEAGYEEYGRGYFARTKEHRFDGESYYFGFGGDYVGFGAGALSTLGHHFLKRSSDLGRYGTIDLGSYLSAPTRMESIVPMGFLPPEALILTSFDNALSLEDGIVYERFADQLGYPFSRVRETAAFSGYLAELAEWGGEIVETETSLSLSAATRVPALLRKHVSEKAPPSLTAANEA